MSKHIPAAPRTLFLKHGPMADEQPFYCQLARKSVLSGATGRGRDSGCPYLSGTKVLNLSIRHSPPERLWIESRSSQTWPSFVAFT